MKVRKKQFLLVFIILITFPIYVEGGLTWIRTTGNETIFLSTGILDYDELYLKNQTEDNITLSLFDSNASTICSGGDVLFGNGSCGTPYDDTDTGIISWDPNLAFVNETNIFQENQTFKKDIIVEEDIEFLGDASGPDMENEIHFLRRTWDVLDELFDDIFFSRINQTIVSDNLTMVEFLGDNFIVNIDRNESELSSVRESVTLNTGTNETPVMSYVQWTDKDNPTLGVTSSLPNVEYADVAQILMGDEGNVYGSIIGSATTYEFINGVYNRFYDQGVVYVDGFNITANSTDISITEGEMTILLDKTTLSGPFSIATDFFFIEANGTFHQTNTFDDIIEYSDGTPITNSKYFNVVFGVVHTEDGKGRLMAVVQDHPSGAEYNKVISAEIDKENKVLIFPSNQFLKKLFVPIARVIIKKDGTDTIEQLSNGRYYFDIRGIQGLAGGSPPSPAITSHADLDDLDFASSGHTGFVSSSQLDSINYDIAWINESNTFTPDQYFSGDVGIGTANPSYKLEVNGDANISGLLYVNSTNVGIGTSNPNQTLHLAIGGNVLASEFITYSDRSLKEEIKEITIDSINNNAKLYEFRFNKTREIYEEIENKTSGDLDSINTRNETYLTDKYIGLMADEVPDICTVWIEVDGEMVEGINYNCINSINFVKIKTLEDKIKEQQQEINTMKSEMCDFNNGFSWCKT